MFVVFGRNQHFNNTIKGNINPMYKFKSKILETNKNYADSYKFKL